jgi:hypothetical protein
MSLNKHAILACHDLPLKEVVVPEWGGSVFLRTFSVGEGIALEAAKKDRADDQVVGLYLAFALGDSEGRRLFTEADLDELYKKSPKVLVRLFHEAVALNQMGEDDDEVREEKS